MIKTVTLAGTELKVEKLDGFNTVVHNLGTNAIYASRYPNIAAGADNVAEIPVNGAKLISMTNGTVYLLGTGKAELTGQDYDGVNFKLPSSISGDGVPSASEGYVDEKIISSLEAAKEYTDNATAPIQESIVAIIADKADKTELPTTLPANGGNADTVNGHTVNTAVPADAKFTDTVYSLPAATQTTLGGVKVGDNLSAAADGTLSAIYSNPNLLDNPDFRINQRGEPGLDGGYTSSAPTKKYFSDRWIFVKGTLSVPGSGGPITLNGTIKQIMENDVGTNVTVSYKATGTVTSTVATETVDGAVRTTLTLTTESSVTITWVKAEIGNKATPFVPPNIALELYKCMRFYQTGEVLSKIYLQDTSISLYRTAMVNFNPVMRVKPNLTIKAGRKNGYVTYYSNSDQSQPAYVAIDSETHSSNTSNKHFTVFVRLTTKPTADEYLVGYAWTASADL